MRCQKCKAELLHDNMEKCPYCGEIIHNHEMYEHGTITKCENCQATVTSEYEICPYCSKKVKNKFNISNILNTNKQNKSISKIILIFIIIFVLPYIISFLFGIIIIILSLLFG